MSEYTVQLPFKFSVSELIKAGRIDEDDLRKMLEWLKTEDQLPQCGEQMMCLFLMACRNNLEATKNCVRAYYQCKRDAPEIFDDRDLQREDIRQQLDVLEFIVIPKRTEEGCVVLMHRLFNFDYTEYHMDVAVKVLFMALDTSLYSDPPTGMIVLFDMRGMGLRHLTRAQLGTIRKFFTYVQDALTLKLNSIHVLNCVWFMDKVMSLIRPFYRTELLSKLHLHKPDMDMEEFYENFIPRCCLPSDLGGELEDSQTLHHQTRKQMEEMQDFFNQEQKMRHSVQS